ncbi:MAG: SoxR reducing system RseC family protein [Prevotella sp.]|nr:SoxR reducing system RseC family protein [Prevotella sp.]
MSNDILHKGTVKAIEKDKLTVQISQTSACAACKAAGHCSASESKEKIIDVYHVDDIHDYHVGDTVQVIASQRIAMNAVLLAFGIPFLIMIYAIFITSRLTTDEALMAIVGLLSLIPYYILLYLFRQKMVKTFSFTVKHF